MSENTSRATIYFDPKLHEKLRIKAADSSCSISDLVNRAVRISLLEDAEDMAVFEERVAEPLISYDEMVERLKSDGCL